ncbi:Uncharacterised protein r2_g1556 [Pycnogonum litorale]
MPFAATEKAFCVLKYAQTQSNVNAQRELVRRFHNQAPTGKQIWTWHKKFQEEGCLCRKKGSGRPAVSEEMVNQVRETFSRSPKMSVRRASLETRIPKSTVWRVLRKRLRLTPYKLQLLQALKPGDMQKRKTFCENMQDKLEDDDFENRFIFSDEATFHSNGKVNKQKCSHLGRRKSTCHNRTPKGLTNSECVLCHLKEPCAWPIFLRGKRDRRQLFGDASELAT